MQPSKNDDIPEDHEKLGLLLLLFEFDNMIKL